MSAPLKETGRAPSHRTNLTRGRKISNFRLRPEIKQQLIGLARQRKDGTPESMTEVVERLITEAACQPRLFA